MANAPIGIPDFLTVHSRGEEQDQCHDTDQQEARGEVGADADIPNLPIDFGEHVAK